MEKVLQVGLIGVGSIASRRHLPAWGKEKRAEVVSISDVDIERAKRVAARFGIKRVYEDYREMIAKEELDICDICTRSGTHVSVAKICLNLGVHVMSEKPMAMTYESGRELFEVIQSCPKMYTVVFNYRFSPPVIALRRLLCEGVLGEVESLRVQFGWKKPDYQDQFKEEYPNGILYETGIHDIDLCISLLGEVRKVQAYPECTEAGATHALTSLIEHSSGVSSKLQVCFCHPRIEHLLEIVGSKGSANIDFRTLQLTTHGINHRMGVTSYLRRAFVSVKHSLRPKQFLFGGQLPFDCIVSNFVNAVLFESPLLVSPPEAFYDLRVANLLDISTRTGEAQIIE
ncbi:MAG: putative oxidoreductase YdgJ [Candidatus Moanabacter tarae]|uniref:Putative oxidoreductase YdgJ n=1 Tax=Candidatus Moanibacter tarae TaxID=2200854 RepID=A0A2Z4AH40_9BACT|nr:MAG: putative oxidoreductase YdgJ [Candidatus Moanabacter tarae]|tara:strand:- start:1553 stop:2581 length:1029 start_codon:yes stop_codon:yes gene_type:complete